ncbi:AAA family ATPase [Pirellulales bacterium]|nr:AAA family ATPase [Pirellulales bacterium]
MSSPIVSNVKLRADADLDADSFPGNLAFIKKLSLDIHSPVTFFVGENGSGKSTLLEAMAVVAGLPICGGGTNDLSTQFRAGEQSVLAESLSLAFSRQPRDRYFFRAESQFHFATLLEQRNADPDFVDANGNRADPFKAYGGSSLHEMSHGEAFLSVMQHRFHSGLLLMDEPESALSPQRQLALLALMHELVAGSASQFFIATHSPILLTFPEAAIISFDHGALRQIDLEETSHFRITRDLLNNPKAYWRHLAAADQSG